MYCWLATKPRRTAPGRSKGIGWLRLRFLENETGGSLQTPLPLTLGDSEGIAGGRNRPRAVPESGPSGPSDARIARDFSRATNRKVKKDECSTCRSLQVFLMSLPNQVLLPDRSR